MVYLNGFKPSRYTHLFDWENGQALVFQARSQSIAIWTYAEQRSFQEFCERGTCNDLTPTMLQEWVKHGFVVSSDIDEVEGVRRDYVSKRSQEGSSTLTILPTLACNFGCDYCFQGCDKPTGRMGDDVQDSLVQLFENLSQHAEAFSVCWYGGEPLLAKNVIYKLSHRFRAIATKSNLRLDGAIVTNGYYLDTSTARALLHSHVSTAQITLDGGRKQHNARRGTLSGQGTYDRILANISSAAREGLRISVRVNIDSRNSDGTQELLGDLVNLDVPKSHLGVYFAQVEAMTEACSGCTETCMTKQDYARLELDLESQAESMGLRQHSPAPQFLGICQAIRSNAFMVLPNGDLHKCWDTVQNADLRVGNLMDLDKASYSKRHRKWLAFDPWKHAGCRECSILPVCAGGCAFKTVHSSETSENAALPCPSWKFETEAKVVAFAESKLAGELNSNGKIHS